MSGLPAVDEATLRRIAEHEAGHGVVGIRFGLIVRSMDLAAGPDRAEAEVQDHPDPRVKAVVYAAGIAAAGLDGAGPDIQEIVALLGGRCWEIVAEPGELGEIRLDPTATRHYTEAVDAARRILDARRDLHRALTAALLERGRIEWDDIRAIGRAHIAPAPRLWP